MRNEVGIEGNISVGYKNDFTLLLAQDCHAVFNLCCSLCTAYEHKAFLDGLQYGAHLVLELYNERKGSSQ